MNNYDFHNLLSPPEFEGLVRDILEIREDLNFHRGKEGKDGGIDLLSSDKKVVVQVKRYQNNYRQLIRSLKSEKLKVQELKPERYIVVSSIEYTHNQREEIFNLFKEYVRDLRDIIGRDELNKYLSQREYKEVEKKHYKLWLTGTNVLQNILHEEIYRGKLNQSKFKLKDITDFKRYRLYVQNKSFPVALEIVEKNNIVVIAGQPGVGKTTLAKQLVLYYLAKNQKYQFINLSKSIDEGYDQYDEKVNQIFFFDDFWGDIFDSSNWTVNEDKRFIEFIKIIRKSNNKKLILTTRDYVLSQGVKRYNKIDEEINLLQYTIGPSVYTKLIKARILLNHLYFSDLSNDVIRDFIWQKKYFNIIGHPNYSPRLIEKFVEIAIEKEYESYEFSFYFKKYLKNPYKYWEEEVLSKQTQSSKFILLLLLISNTPILLDSLFVCFKRLVKYCNSYGINVSIDEFKESIKTLENSIIVSNPYFDSYKIEFQNPSIKDFLLEFLRKNINEYGELLIKSASFFNQLIFVFTTKNEEKISDHDLEAPLYGKKITLNTDLKNLLKEKLLQEFDQLQYSEIKEGNYAGFSISHDKDDTLVWKLIEFHHLFDLNIDIDVRNFVLNKFQSILEQYNEEGKLLPKEGMSDFPALIKIVHAYTKINKEKLIRDFYNSITFTSEFLSFYELKEIFPTEYSNFVSSNIKSIRKNIKQTVLDDANYYYEEDLDIELDIHLHHKYPEVFKAFGLKISEKVTDELYELAGKKIPSSDREYMTIQEDEGYLTQQREDEATDEVIEDEFQVMIVSDDERYFGDEDKTIEITDYVKREVKDDTLAGNIVKELEKHEFQYLHLTDTPSDLNLLIDYLKEFSSLPAEENDLFAGFLKIYSSHATKAINISSEEIICLLEKLAYHTYLDSKRSFSEQYVTNLFSEIIESECVLLTINELFPLLTKQRNWYEFAIGNFQEFLTAKYVSKLPDSDKANFYKVILPEIYNRVNRDILDLWKFCSSLDTESFNTYFVLPQLIEFSKNINDDDERLLCRTFFKLFEVEFELKYCEEEKGLVWYTRPEHYWSDFIEFLEIPLDIHMLDLFFHGDPYENYIVEIPITTDKKIHQKVRKYLQSYHVNTREKENPIYRVNLVEFEKDDYFFSLLKELGMVEYITEGYKKLKEKIKELE